MTTFKICNTCKINKNFTEYGLRKSALDGHKNKCKDCDAVYKRKHYLKHQDRYLKEKKIYREENRDKLNKQSLELYHKNKEKYQKARDSYCENNKEKINEYHKEYYLENKVRLNIINSEYYKNNKEKMNSIGKKYYTENKEHLRKINKEYVKNNKESIKKYKKKWSSGIDGKLSKKVSNHIRNSKIRITNDKTITKKSLENLLLKQNNKCKYCNIDLDFNTAFEVHLDHVIPISKGGHHSINNIVFSCKSCNLKKHDKIIT